MIKRRAAKYSLMAFVMPHVLVWASLLIVTLYSDVACAIVGGTLDGDGHPNVGASVRSNHVANELGLSPIQCSGTLVHPRVFLTAGHCTEILEHHLAQGLYTLDDVGVTFDPDASDPDTVLPISDVTTHPEYDANLNNGQGNVKFTDLGVLILTEDVDGIAPSTLAPEGFLDYLADIGQLHAHPGDGTPFTAVGYGIDEVHPDWKTPPLPDGRRRVAVTEFDRLFDEWLITSQHFSQDEGGTAIRDSGGPVFWVDPATGEEVQVGITSRGDWGFAAFTGFYRADIPETIDFIDSVIARVEAGEFDARKVALQTAIQGVPEPSSVLLMATSAIGMLFRRQRRRDRTSRC